MKTATGRITAYFDFVKIGHTLFALPFCLISAFLASQKLNEPMRWTRLVGIVLAFAAARAFAMAVNRILDRKFDALNPRTANRHIPAGTISLPAATAFAAACAGVFILSAYSLNPLCGHLAFAALLYLAFYSVTKRFTSWSHLVLGGALALAPLGAELAVRGEISPATVALAIGVALWVCGFDMIYAMLDIDFDRQTGLYSIPAKFGRENAASLAGLFHAGAALGFLAFGHLAGLGELFFAAQFLVLGLLAYEQTLIRQNELEAAFLQVNVAVSIIQLSAVILDYSLLSRV